MPSPPQRYTYDPAMLPSWLNALMTAIATARFAGGRGIELLNQARKVMKAAYDCAMRNLDTDGQEVSSTMRRAPHKET